MINEIKHWIENFVSVHNETIGQTPCPFAKEALIRNKIDYKEVDKNNTLSTLVHLADHWNDDFEVVCLYAKTNEFVPSELTELVTAFNNNAMDKDIVALEDHPDDIEEWKSVSLNFGKCIIVLVQRLSKLNQASKILKKKGYYDSWDKEHYEEVVDWRFK